MKYINKNTTLRASENLHELSNDMQGCKTLLKRFEKIEQNFIELGIDVSHFESIKNIINYRLFLSILYADICCGIIFYSKAESEYEEKFAIRNLIIVITEGIKKIYNFTKVNKEGHLISSKRNNSFWKKEIKYIIENDCKILNTKYHKITQNLNEFLSHDFEKIKNIRDVSIHYDKDSIATYEIIDNLKFEDYSDLIINFMKLLNEMIFFTKDVDKCLDSLFNIS